jgi:hypothetical protein
VVFRGMAGGDDMCRLSRDANAEAGTKKKSESLDPLVFGVSFYGRSERSFVSSLEGPKRREGRG